ncbi:MAG TPA: neuraminidase-like domain-containing protein [Micromonosporaceae bacterium]|nr:neuraminidase-like domain-containing protein [Micromonosporaceae bacterium]
MQVWGRAYFDNGQPAEQLTLRFVHIGFNARAETLAETVTGEGGGYAVTLDVAGPVNLEVRAVTPPLAAPAVDRAARGDRPGRVSADDEPTMRISAMPARPATAAATRMVVTRLSSVQYNLRDRLPGPLHLVVPARLRPMAGEHARLAADLQPHLLEAELGSAVEDPATRDLTLLHYGTGWDARLVALAATADRLSRDTGIEAPALYGMVRAGLPADPLQLARANADAVTKALRAAAGAGVVTLTEAQIGAAVQAHQAYAVAARRSLVRGGTVSSWGDLLTATGLPGAQAATLESLFTEFGGEDRPVQEFWDAVSTAGLPVDTLRTTARLAYLTLNNAALVSDLLPRVGSAEQLGAALVDAALYQPQQWVARVKELAGADEESLAAMVPPTFAGGDVEQRLAAYAADLARKVRISYPTQVVGHMVATDQLHLGAHHDAVKSDVATVLDTAATQYGFSLGRTPLNPFLAEHGGALFGGMSPDQVVQATAQVKKLARLYQVTPTDEAMKVLLDQGIGGALDITAMSYDEFVGGYAGLFGDAYVAERVYRKAQQVTTVIYTFLGVVKQSGATVALPAASAPPEVAAQAKQELTKQYPTLEQLFGSMDFCECEHCRSILSPAAYLVNLLKFLDPAADVWAKRLTEWKAAHGGAAYPYPDVPTWVAAGSPTPMTPYEALRERRPDLPKLPLTCENTNTALPYLDVVNEVLEQYVAAGTLAGMPVFDTGTARSEDLLAEPANLVVDAYDTLKDAAYPMTLPFDLWLATVREFCDRFDAPLWTLLEALCPTAELYPGGGQEYGRAAVFLDALGIPPAERRILTAASPLASWRELYGLDGTVTDQQAVDLLKQAKPLARRLRVSYRELVALVRTGFLNPHLEALATLRKLDLSVEDTLRYREQPGHPPFTAEEKAALEADLGPDGTAWLQAVDLDDLAKVLVLADPSAACGFDTTVLQHLDGTPAGPIDFLLLNLFVRVWRRLGWPIAELDRALLTFLPGTPDPRTPAGIGPALGSALLGLAHLDTLATLLKAGRKGRGRLVSLWAPLDDRRYAELFLTAPTAAADPAFDDPLGHYLTDGTVLLADHLPAVQSALRLTADDIGRILADAQLAGPSGPYTVDDAPLAMAVVSVLHRYGMLAKLLKMPVTELVVLKGLTGLDPFAAPPAQPVTQLADDHAYGQAIGFVRAAATVAESGLKVDDLAFLLRHRFDPLGPHRGAATPPLALLRSLATEIRRIRAEHAVPADPLLLTDEVLRTKLALVYPPDVTDTLMAMWTDVVPLRAVYAAAPGDALDAADFAAVPQVSVAYDPVRQEQSLVHRGVLLDSERTALVAAVDGSQPSYLDDLLDDVQQQAHALFDRHLLHTTLPGVGEVGFLAAGDFGTIFAAPPLAEDADRARRGVFAAKFLPYLQERLIRALVVETVTADLGRDPALTEALVTEATLLDLPDQPGTALLASYVDTGRAGLTGTTPALDARRLSGYVEVPATGAYRFFVAGAAAGTQVDLRFDHLSDPVLHATVAQGEPEPSAFVDLRAGVPYGLTLDWAVPGGTDAQLLVQADGLPKGGVDRLACYPRDAVEALHRAHLLVDKATTLLAELEVTEPEARHLLTHPADFGGLDLGELPTRTADDTDNRAHALFGQFLRLCAYRRLRGELKAGPDLVGVFQAARRAFPADVAPATAATQALAAAADRLAGLTRRDRPTVLAALKLLGVAAVATPGPDPYPVVVAGLANEVGVARAWRVLQLAGQFGVGPAVLGRWATPEPDAAVARDLRDTLRARYEPETWRGVVKPIADRLRRRRRDALVAHILHATDLDRLEQLYELFLVDPGTEPVVQTSRLRLAISSVQLFIQRCLLNLEPKVSPSAIKAAHWQWMKRYRFSEANFKILLWPENWLEPEFRDDKTHLFAELEGALTQSDLSNEDAEDALFGYLRGLDELARLDIRAVYVEQQTDPADNILHVVGRTFAQGHRYFYRTLKHGEWSPWLPVTVDIEGDHVAIAKWRDRVYVFWVTFLTEPDKPDPGDMSDDSAATLTLGQLTGLDPQLTVRLRLSWTQWFQGEWTPAGSSGTLWAQLSSPLTSFVPANEFVHATTASDGSVWVHLSGQLGSAIRLVSKHARPTVHKTSAPAWPPFTGISRVGEGRYEGDKTLSAYYAEKIITQNGKTTTACPSTVPILGKISEYDLVTNATPIGGMPSDVGRLVLPFFVADEHHTFYVEPVLTEQTIEEGDQLIFAVPLVEAAFKEPVLVAHVPFGAPVEKLPPEAVYSVVTPVDDVTAAGSQVVFGDVLIGQAGGLNLDLNLDLKGQPNG